MNTFFKKKNSFLVYFCLGKYSFDLDTLLSSYFDMLMPIIYILGIECGGKSIPVAADGL